MRSSSAARLFVLSALLAAPAGMATLSGQEVTTPLDGEMLADELGCGACHSGVPGPALARSRAPVLGGEGAPLPGEFIFEYLADPQVRRPDLGRTRMPDFRLDEGERVALALYLGSGPATGSFADAMDRHPGVDASTGRRISEVLGCAGCHQGLPLGRTGVGPDLSREGVRVRPEWLSGFLRNPSPVRTNGQPGSPGARMPDFRLDEREAGSLESFLSGQGSSFAGTPGEPGVPGDPLTPIQERRVERLLESRVACLGCHRIGDRGGRIGPSLDGLSERLTPSFVWEMVQDPARAVPGSPMPHQPLPPVEVGRIARYLLDRPGGPVPPEPMSLVDPSHPLWSVAESPESDGGEADSGEGAVLYGRHCAACHGTSGDGDGWNAPALPVPPTHHSDADLMGRRPDDTLFDGIHAGAWVLDGSAWMPSFGDLLSGSQIRSLVAYIRELCDCAGPAWSGLGRGGS